MKIEKIKKLPSGKYKIVLENEEKVVTYDDVILKNGLLFSKELGTDVLNQLKLDTHYYDIYHRIVRLISRRIRSEKEIREYLEKYTTVMEDREKVIADLKKVGLIDDTVFAQAYLSDKIHFTGSGPMKIKADLLEHNIPEIIIEEALRQLDPKELEEKLDKMIQKRVKGNTKYSASFLKKKLYQELTMLGYEGEMVNRHLSHIEVVSTTLKEAQKLYQKYSKKKEGKELYYFIKQKLYQKGFTMEEIGEVLNALFETE